MNEPEIIASEHTHNETPKPEPITSADSLLERYSEQAGATLDFSLPRGEKFKARKICDSSEIIKLEKKASALAKLCQGKTVPEAWVPLLPVEHTIIRFCVYIEETLLEPKLTFLDCLKLAKNCGPLIPLIGTIITEAMAGASAVNTLNEIDDAKNDFGAAV